MYYLWTDVMYPYSPHSTYTTSLIAGRLWQILFSVLGCRARCSINLLAGMNIALPPLNLPYSLLTVFCWRLLFGLFPEGCDVEQCTCSKDFFLPQPKLSSREPAKPFIKWTFSSHAYYFSNFSDSDDLNPI